MGFHPTPVDPQGLQQLGTKGHIAVPTSFALVNANHHTLAVDVGDLQAAEFGAAHRGGVKGHQQRAVIGVARGINKSGNFLGAENGGQPSAELGKGNVLAEKVPAQSLEKEEAQGGRVLLNVARRELLALEKVRLILTDLLGAELIR